MTRSMKSMINSFPGRALLGVGILAVALTSASAQNLVTFQVDMNSAPTTPTDVFVRGSFNNWGNPPQSPTPMTNDGFGVWSATIDITNTPGTVIQCKFFYQPGDIWESDPNRQFVLAGGAQTLPLTAWNVKDWPVPSQNVTFQVDMTAQVQLGFYEHGQPVRVAGPFTGWGDGADMTNNPSLSGVATNIFVAVVPVSAFPGNTQLYKFRGNNGWENDPNRSFVVAGGDQVLPVVYYNNLAPSTPTNAVTFQVDMGAQSLAGNFFPGDLIRVAGSMYSPPWGDGIDLTNNPALPGNASNIYSAVINVIASPGATFEYKFRLNGGWENPLSTGGGNRPFQITGGDQVLPLVSYKDLSLCDLLRQETQVTFWLRITNGTVATDGTVFDRSTHTVHINGNFNSWNGGNWDVTMPQMENDPSGSDFFKFTTVLPVGNPVRQQFKFGIVPFLGANADNEAPQFQDHVQYIRTLGNTYVMPTAEFGTNYAATRVEQSFGNLTIGVPVGGQIPINWLGHPCVTLQTRADLDPGSWTDLPATDAAQSTNWPNTGNAFFRLYKRATP